jgi:hypothetical protein
LLKFWQFQAGVMDFPAVMKVLEEVAKDNMTLLQNGMETITDCSQQGN